MTLYDPYEKYGLKRIINASTSLTRLGGSMPKHEVFKAMEDASKAFIRINELQVWAGKIIAESFNADAGLPTACAVSALTLASAACMMKDTELENFNPLDTPTWIDIVQKIPMHTEGLKTEFITIREDLSEYNHAVECAGGKIIAVTGTEDTIFNELDQAYRKGETAAYYYTIHTPKEQVPLHDVIRIAHSHDTPVIVDAAPYLTHNIIPKMLLEMGVDLLAFSGGKHLGGLNNTGLLIGRKDLIKLAHLQSYPFDGVGRGAKMSREVIVGLIKALELFMDRDDEAYYKGLEEKSREFADRLGEVIGLRSGVTYEPTVFPNLTPPSYAYIEVLDQNISLKKIHELLRDGEPGIECLLEPFFITPDAKDKITFKVEYLLEGDDDLIIKRLKEIMKNN